MKWNKHIRKEYDNGKVYIITRDGEFYRIKDKYIFFTEEKSAYEYTMANIGTAYVQFYLSRYRVG